MGKEIPQNQIASALTLLNFEDDTANLSNFKLYPILNTGLSLQKITTVFLHFG